MADETWFHLLPRRQRSTLCTAQQTYSVTAMLPFFVYFLKRKRAFHWSPAVDLRDPFIAAALAPVSHS
jgi:hypothetical protein